jgi:hypothetical protein
VSIAHRITFKFQNGTDILEVTKGQSSGQERNMSEAIAISATDALVAFTCDFSQLKSLYIKCDQALTIKTNSSGAPAQTITLAANVPYVWTYGSGITCPITADITALYITNGSGSLANLEIRALEDPTA